MTFAVPYRLAHHSLALTMLLFATSCIPSSTTDRGWLLTTLAWVLLIAAALSGLIVLSHVRHATDCTLCKPLSAQHVARPHNQLRLAYGRYGLFLLVPAFAAYPFVAPLAQEATTSFNWPKFLSSMTMLLLASSYAACRRFYRLHDPARAEARELHTWMKQNAQGLVHRSHLVVIAAMLLIASSSLLPKDDSWTPWKNLTVIALLGAFVLDQHHTMSLCETCVTEFRTDAPEYAAARRWRFYSAHRIIFVLVPLFLAGAASVYFGSGFWEKAALISTYLMIAAATLLNKFHVRYQPWCPLCHRGGGGDDENEPTPEPTGDNGKPLPVT